MMLSASDQKFFVEQSFARMDGGKWFTTFLRPVSPESGRKVRTLNARTMECWNAGTMRKSIDVRDATEKCGPRTVCPASDGIGVFLTM